MRKAFFTDIIAAIFILLFVYAAASKLMSYNSFYQQLTQSPLLTRFARPASIATPAIEILLSIMLCRPAWRLAGFFLSFSLMLMFTWYVVVIILFSDYIPCSCGGILSSMNWQQHLVFNTVFVLLAAIAVLLHESVPLPLNKSEWPGTAPINPDFVSSFHKQPPNQKSQQ